MDDVLETNSLDVILAIEALKAPVNFKCKLCGKVHPFPHTIDSAIYCVCAFYEIRRIALLRHYNTNDNDKYAFIWDKVITFVQFSGIFLAINPETAIKYLISRIPEKVDKRIRRHLKLPIKRRFRLANKRDLYTPSPCYFIRENIRLLRTDRFDRQMSIVNCQKCASIRQYNYGSDCSCA